jgi:hypothetical protein
LTRVSPQEAGPKSVYRSLPCLARELSPCGLVLAMYIHTPQRQSGQGSDLELVDRRQGCRRKLLSQASEAHPRKRFPLDQAGGELDWSSSAARKVPVLIARRHLKSLLDILNVTVDFSLLRPGACFSWLPQHRGPGSTPGWATRKRSVRPCSAAGARCSGCSPLEGALFWRHVSPPPAPSVDMSSIVSILSIPLARSLASSAVNRTDMAAPRNIKKWPTVGVMIHRPARSTPAHITASLVASLFLCQTTSAFLSS